METKEHDKTWNTKLNAFYDRCRQAGLKMTPQRLAVYKALIQTDLHPTAEEVYQTVRRELPTISLDTVNRTLLTLAEIGAAFIVEGTGQPRRYDGGMEEHQHFRCLKCGKIIDFHYEPYDQIETPTHLGDFKVIRKTVYFEGYCPACCQDN
ncbi:MAG TPA: transcriptional repressor [Phycisphaerales bacterium]|nr:transcriptional repressor [Phycisphaerales bacterium]